MSCTRLAAVFSLISVLSGCAVQVAEPGQPSRAVTDFVDRQRRSAVLLEQQGHLHLALVHWQTAARFKPAHPAARDNINRLQRLINQRAAQALAAGKEHLAAGRDSQAGDAYLQVLALQPNQKEALAQLRRLDSRRVSRLQSRKSAAENEARLLLQTGITDAVLEEFSALVGGGRHDTFLQRAQAYPQADRHPQFKLLKASALAGAADQAEAAGRLQQAVDYLQQALVLNPDAKPAQARLQKLKQQLSDQWMTEGVQLIARDPQQAVEKLQQAVAYNPDNAVARTQLQRARKLHANLQKLRARSGTN